MQDAYERDVYTDLMTREASTIKMLDRVAEAKIAKRRKKNVDLYSLLQKTGRVMADIVRELSVPPPKQADVFAWAAGIVFGNQRGTYVGIAAVLAGLLLLVLSELS